MAPASYSRTRKHSRKFTSPKFLTKFIEAYKSFPCLWDVHCDEFSSTDLKYNAYQQLLKLAQNEIPEASLKYVRLKLASLRFLVRQELRKVKESENSSTGEKYVPKLWYFDLLQFAAEPKRKNAKHNADASDILEHNTGNEDVGEGAEASNILEHNEGVGKNPEEDKSISDGDENSASDHLYTERNNFLNSAECKERFMNPGFLKGFIKAYQNLPCLWRFDNLTFIALDKRIAAYEQLKDITKTIIPEATVNFVMSMILSLRSNFENEVRKAENDPGYVSELWYYELMMFLVGKNSFKELKKVSDYDFSKMNMPVEVNRKSESSLEENGIPTDVEKCGISCPTPVDVISEECDARFMSPSFIKEFIVTYQNLPCLWKTKCKEYGIQSLKVEAYQKLVYLTQEIIPHADVDYVKHKIKEIRKSYKKEFREIERSKEASTTYVPKLWYYDCMGFLEFRNEKCLDEEDSYLGQSATRSPSLFTKENRVKFLQPSFLVWFLDKYRNLPSLWDPNSPDFYDKDKYNDALNQLVKLMKTIIPEADQSFVKAGIETLKRKFKYQMKKLKDASQDASEKKCAPKLWWIHLWPFPDVSDTYSEEDQSSIQSPPNTSEFQNTGNPEFQSSEFPHILDLNRGDPAYIEEMKDEIDIKEVDHPIYPQIMEAYSVEDKFVNHSLDADVSNSLFSSVKPSFHSDSANNDSNSSSIICIIDNPNAENKSFSPSQQTKQEISEPQNDSFSPVISNFLKYFPSTLKEPSITKLNSEQESSEHQNNSGVLNNKETGHESFPPSNRICEPEIYEVDDNSLASTVKESSESDSESQIGNKSSKRHYLLDKSEGENNVSTDVSQPPAKRRRLPQVNVENWSNSSMTFAAAKAPESEDEYDAFCKVVASKLRKMVPMQRLIADKLINDILYEGLFSGLTPTTRIIDINKLHKQF